MVRICLVLALCIASAARAAPALEVNLWARASIAGVDNGAVYGTFTNSGKADVSITSASTNVAAMTMIHKTVVKEGMVTMEPMHSLVVPAGQTVECKPGKCHIMLMGLKHPLKPGDRFEVTLVLDGGSSLEASVTVGSIGQMTAP